VTLGFQRSEKNQESERGDITLDEVSKIFEAVKNE
jgi:hypothetical protein